MNLILFSGGVESTALLTKASSRDLIVTIQPCFSSDTSTYNCKSIDKILEYFGFKTNYVSLTLPDSNKAFVHQMKVFVSLCSIIVSSNPEIKQVWCGRNSIEPNTTIKPMIEKYMGVWRLIHPEVPFNHPLDHLSKKDQYQLIPTKVQSYISSCIYHRYCGRCYKCKEWLCLSQNFQETM